MYLRIFTHKASLNMSMCVKCVVYGDERYPSKSSKSCPMNFIILSTKTNLPQQQNASWRLDTKEAQIYICACDEKTSKAPPYLHALKLRSSTTASTIIIHTLAICRVFSYRASLFIKWKFCVKTFKWMKPQDISDRFSMANIV